MRTIPIEKTARLFVDTYPKPDILYIDERFQEYGFIVVRSKKHAVSMDIYGGEYRNNIEEAEKKLVNRIISLYEQVV